MSTTRWAGAALAAAIAFATALVPSAAQALAANGRIVFDSDRDGDTEIFSIRSDGTELRKLTDNDAWDDAPAVSPDGARVAWVRESGGVFGLWVMNLDGSAETELVSSNDREYGGPTWSPDGSQIVFSRSAAPGTARQSLFRVNADGTGLVRLTNSDLHSDYAPTWSPDGTSVAWTREVWDTGAAAAWTMAPDGSDKVRIPGTTDAHALDWSPTGDRLAFQSKKEFDRCPSWCAGIYLVNPDGTGKTLLTPEPGRDGVDYIEPAWSPNGLKIVFAGDRYHPDPDGFTPTELYAITVETSSLTRLTLAERADDGQPDWGRAVPVTP